MKSHSYNNSWTPFTKHVLQSYFSVDLDELMQSKCGLNGGMQLSNTT